MAATIVIANAAESVSPPVVVKTTVKFAVPAVVGVPLITPVAPLSDKPPGSAPEVNAQEPVRLPTVLKVVE